MKNDLRLESGRNAGCDPCGDSPLLPMTAAAVTAMPTITIPTVVERY